jgi:PAS domain S-box-containing protein
MDTALHILHLEDDINDAGLVHATLEEGGVACDMTRVETEAAFLAALETGIDMVLADYRLPSFDGLSALAITKERHPEIPFIFVSGTMGEELAIETIRSGATDYVIKQRLSRLVPAVRRALRETVEHYLLKKTEDSLENLRHQNKLILDSVAEGIFGLDLNGDHTFVNPAGAEMLGYKIEELIGKNSHRICHHSRADGSPYQEKDCPIHKAYKEGLVQHVRDEVFWRKDGTSFPVAYTSTPILERGKVAGAVVTFRDITERKQAEEELRKHRDHLEELVQVRTSDLNTANEQLKKEISERIRAEEQIRLISGRLEFLLSSNPAVIYTATADDDFPTTFITRNVSEVLGYRPREFVDSPVFWKEHIHPDDLRRLSPELSQLLEHGRSKMEYRFRRKDHGYVWIYDEAQLIRDKDGKPIEIIGFIMNITDRKVMEETLQRREHEIRMIANNVPALFSYVGRDCTYGFVNKRYEEWFQMSRGEIIGRHMRQIIGKPAYETVKDKVTEALAGTKVNYEVEVPYGAGSRWMSVIYVPDADIDGNVKGFYSLASDITERKRAEE